MIGALGRTRPGGVSALLRAGAVAAPAALLILGSVAVPLPLVSVHPGPATSTGDLIRIDAATFSSKGSQHVTTVTLHDATLAEAVAGWLSPAVSVLPRTTIYPPGTTRDEVNRRNASEMDASQEAAKVAALRELGYEIRAAGALVQATVEGMPAAKTLTAGDVIVAADGTPVGSAGDLGSLIGRHGRGEAVRLTVRRGGDLREVWVPVVREGGRSLIGVRLLPSFALPFRIEIDSGGIGGPSAGLAFALSIVDRLDSPDLTGGRTVAGTGTIDYDGNVGPIGGVPQKVRSALSVGARIFLVPRDQAGEAHAEAGGRMDVVGVATLHEAVTALLGRSAA